MVRGTATAFDMKSMTRYYGHEVKVALEIASVSGLDMSLRLGAGMVRHVDTQWLWVQGVSTGEKQRLGQNQKSAMKQTS